MSITGERRRHRRDIVKHRRSLCKCITVLFTRDRLVEDHSHSCNAQDQRDRLAGGRNTVDSIDVVPSDSQLCCRDDYDGDSELDG